MNLSTSSQPLDPPVAQATDDIANAGWREQYPFESKFMAVGGQSPQGETGDAPGAGGPKIHYIDEGATGDNSAGHQEEVILMMHGNPTWSFYWRHLVKGLSDEYRTVAIDHLGCGLSDKPTDYDYCLENHIDNACQLVEKLNLTNVTLMAHDWGGAIGMGTLLRLKERFSRIVLFNTAAFPPPFIPFRIRVCRWPVFGKIGLQGFNLFARAAITMATEQPQGLDKATVDGLLAPYDSWANRVAIYKFVKDIPLSPSHRTWEVLANIETGLKSVKHMPTKLIWGMKDWCFRPECLDRLTQHWPEADVTRFEDGGHYIVEDKSREITPLVREFLKNNPVSS